MSNPTESGQGAIVPYGPAQAVWIDGRVIPIPSGGSDTTTAGTSEGGSTEEPPEPGTEDSGVQSDGDDEQQSSGGQEFIEPYLEGLDPRIRPHVQEKLEQFRKDQDAQVNKKLESVNEELSGFKQYADSPDELEVPVAFYSSMVNDPINTLEWLFDRFDQELGRDLRSEVKEMMQSNASASGGDDPTQQLTQNQPGQTQEGGNEDPSQKPLTKADLDAYFEQKEKERQDQQEQEKAEEQQRQQVNSWVDEAAKKFSFPLDADDPLRQTIITEAGRLFEQGQTKDGKQAVEMATESLVTKLKNKVGGSQKPGQLTTPKVANGGQAPHQQKPDISNPKARQDYMAALLTGGAGSE